MFNGIIFKTGKVKNILKNKDSIYVGIQSKINLNKRDIGSSVCCDGICLTIAEIKNKKLYFYVSNETLKKTNFKKSKKKSNNQFRKITNLRTKNFRSFFSRPRGLNSYCKKNIYY